MSVWATEQVEERIIEILGDVQGTHGDHHFGRPYLSAYQLAIEMERRYPQVRAALGCPLGGVGAGEHRSLAQYLARQLSERIRSNALYPVEGRFIAHDDLIELVYRAPDGQPLVSSLTDSQDDLSLYRLRPPNV